MKGWSEGGDGRKRKERGAAPGREMKIARETAAGAEFSGEGENER